MAMAVDRGYLRYDQTISGQDQRWISLDSAIFFYIKQAGPSTRHRIIELQGQEKKIKMLRSRCLNGEDSHNEYKHHANNKLFFA